MRTSIQSRLSGITLTIGLAAAALVAALGCGTRSSLSIDDSELNSGGRSSSGSDGAASGGTTQPEAPLDPRLCVFDYDLTLSSHDCPELEGDSSYFCRTNTCDTYGWYSQCLGKRARAAVAECVRRHALIGIASHASADACWNDKVIPVITEDQFPELTGSPEYAKAEDPLAYPRIDSRSNWNCEDCAYTMDGSVSKPDGIARVMRHYGLDPASAADRKRVIFWDDTPSNITAVNRRMPEVRAVLVTRFTNSGADGGCGITQADIDAGWAP